MKLSAVRAKFPLLDWFLQAKRIPLLFSITIVSGIFYHYAPALTLLWIVLSLLLQTPLFRLFDYMKKHHILGGIIYCAAGLLFLAAAVGFIFTFAFYKGGSLLPCILAHSLVDVTSVFAADEGSQTLNLILHALVVVVAAAYCFYLAKRVETPAINRTEREQGPSSGRDRS